VAVASQENYLVTWLPQLIRTGRRPNVRPSAIGVKRAKEAGLVDAGATPAQIQAQLEADLDRIGDGAKKLVRVVAHDPEGVAGPTVQRLEAALTEVRAHHAETRMLFDNADDRTSEAQEIIKKMMWVGPVAHGLESLNLGAAAKLFAGTADDLLGEYAEVKALLGAGFSGREVAKRLQLSVPVFGAATWASGQVEHLLAAGKDLEAGALFGASAVALSLTTALQSMAMYKKAYDALLADGKIPGKAALAGSPQFQAALKTFGRSRDLLSPASKGELLALVRKHLEPLAERLGRAEVETVMQSLEHLDLAELSRQLEAPSRLERWKTALQQDFSNPARLGILLGSAVAPVVGLGAAKLGLLHNGFVLAAVGSVESIVGGLTVHAARVLDDWKYKRSLERKIGALPR
jgi:hypothetical protein